MDSCLFCKMADGRIPTDFFMQNEEFFVIRDIAPQAPVHLLVIPRVHVQDAAQAVQQDAGLVGRLVATAVQAAQQAGLQQTGYRLLMNTGADAGQTVPHLHLHVLGGGRLSDNLGV